jgi:hypothetical protein
MLGRLQYALSTLEKPLMNGVMEMTLQFLDLRCGRYCILSIFDLKFLFLFFKISTIGLYHQGLIHTWANGTCHTSLNEYIKVGQTILVSLLHTNSLPCLQAEWVKCTSKTTFLHYLLTYNIPLHPYLVLGLLN